MTNFEFMEKAQARLAKDWNFLNAKYGRNFTQPKLFFDLKGRPAGMATGASIIQLNMTFVKNDSEGMLNQALPHEIAHCWLTACGDPSHVRSSTHNIAHFMSTGRMPRRNPHGYTFMSTLALLGGKRERCHDFTPDSPSFGGGKVQRQWLYRCPKCGKQFEVSTTAHNKIRQGQKRWHKGCGYDVDNVIVRVV